MANRYWVGGVNAWDSSTTAYWSATSGGAGGASVPTSADDVFFDSGTTITVTGTVVCRSLTVNASASVGYSGGATIQIYGSLYFGPSFVGWYADTEFLSTTTGNTVYMGASTAFNGAITFNGSGGEWSQTSGCNFYGGANLLRGTFSTGGYPFSVTGFYSSNTNTRTLNLGSSVIYAYASWNVSTSTNLTVTYSPGGSILATGVFYGGGKSWPSISNGPTNGTLDIYGSNTFYALTAESSFAYPGVLSLESGTTTTVLNNISLTGVSSSLLYLQASGVTPAIISKASGTVSATYTNITKSTATGGATFSAPAGLGNVNGGGNTGWIFSASGGNFFVFL